MLTNPPSASSRKCRHQLPPPTAFKEQQSRDSDLHSFEQPTFCTPSCPFNSPSNHVASTGR